MRLSTKGRYALRAMVDLALHGANGPVRREEIAARQEVSALYLAQLFTKLVKVGLVESVMGPGGGYVLARPASEIGSGDIIRAVEEPLVPVFCADAEPEESCHRRAECVTHLLWMDLGQRIEAFLDGVTLQDLRDQACELTSQQGVAAGTLAAGREVRQA
jgi:Rrf2 family iron-sulfur cluster assembly transcriptional regulator